MFELPFNKYTAIVIVLVILIICYFYIKHKNKQISDNENLEDNDENQSNKKEKKKNKNKIENKIQKSKKETKSKGETHIKIENDEKDEIEEKAEQLYKLVHKDFCKDITNDEFLEKTGDLGNISLFIELTQLYNQCKQSGKNCDSEITSDDYVRIIKSESD